MAREQHENKKWHLHVFIHFSSTINQTDGNEMLTNGDKRKCTIKHVDLDLLGHHGNYQAPRSDACVTKYCIKDDDYIWWGKNPKTTKKARANHKKALFAELITGKLSVDDFVRENPEQIANYIKLKTNVESFHCQQTRRTERPEVWFIQGEPGAGKTLLATAVKPLETYMVPLTGSGQTWWVNGYKGESTILFDNISTDCKPPMDWMLKIMDNRPCPSQVKGGMVDITASLVIMTSTDSPTKIWGDKCDNQFMRRLTLWTQATWMNTMDGRDVSWKRVNLSNFLTTLAPATSQLLETLKTNTATTPKDLTSLMITTLPMIGGSDELDEYQFNLANKNL